VSPPASTWAWLQKMPPTAKLVLVKLADNADEWGYCFPGQRFVAERTGLSKRSVINQVKWLQDNGFITKAKRERRNGSTTSNGYHLLIGSATDALATHVDAAVQEMHLEAGGNGAGDAPITLPKVQDVHPKGAGDAPPQPSLNPQEATPSFVKTTMDTLEGIRKYPPGNYPAEAKAVKAMEKLGYTTAEILACYEDKKKDPWWKEKPLTMMSVKSAIGEWKKHNNGPKMSVPDRERAKHLKDAERFAARR